MMRNPVVIWIILSVGTWITGIVWKIFDPANSTAFLLYFIGWVSSLLAIGYFSTPSNSLYGKIAFGCVVVMVMGIVMKVLHFAGAHESIIIGLLGVAATYILMWLGKKPDPK